jgi:TPR repeat protein
MKLLFRPLAITFVVLCAIVLSQPAGSAASYNTYVMGKAGNRARIAQIQRNEALQRQQQHLRQQQELKKEKEQQQAAATNNNSNRSAPVPNPPSQNILVAPTSPYRATVTTNGPAKPKPTQASRSDEPRSLPVSEFSGPAYNDSDSLLEYQREQAQKGNPESQYAIGLRYLDGNGLIQSDALAREWLSKSSANGNLKARAKLRELENER